MRTRDKIIQASITLFNEHGERQITTNHIAAHLGISPGNLYYHFRNKNDIIQSIFSIYKSQLETSFTRVEPNNNTIALLRHSLDSIFELMWRFNFFYSNLPDILSRDPKLQAEYSAVQAEQTLRIKAMVHQLKSNGLLNIDEEDIEDFVNSLKLTATFWISYLKTQDPTVKIEKPMIYQGVFTVLLMCKPYLTAADQASLKDLQQHYAQMAL